MIISRTSAIHTKAAEQHQEAEKSPGRIFHVRNTDGMFHAARFYMCAYLALEALQVEAAQVGEAYQVDVH